MDKNAPSSKEMKILDVLKDLSRTSCATIEEWRLKAIDLGLLPGTSEDASKKAIQRIANKLRSAGFVEKGIGKGVWKPTDLDE